MATFRDKGATVWPGWRDHRYMWTSLVSVVVGGVLTLAGSWFLYRSQRQSARDDRLWTRRADAYIDALHKMPSCDSDQWRLYVPELAARLDAFASSQVLKLYEAAIEAHDALNWYANENGLVSAPDEPLPLVLDAELLALRQQSDAAKECLRDQIRKELGTPEDPHVRATRASQIR